ncbi:hypothetical protein E2C01_095781 [Portunus trituberculatus]|uniref:Uncharacterized protein n=1 Tax=Portunus trituberculatus TaxID=210409 RepID=A0A5B7K1A6_PORTR|nr:hypothetical protein [Portunus trituberculatus]
MFPSPKKSILTRYPLLPMTQPNPAPSPTPRPRSSCLNGAGEGTDGRKEGREGSREGKQGPQPPVPTSTTCSEIEVTINARVYVLGWKCGVFEFVCSIFMLMVF